MNGKQITVLAIVLGLVGFGRAEYPVKIIDLLQIQGVEVNGAGPLLVREDPARQRVVLINTYTSAVSLIDTRDHTVRNIPLADRVPQYVKDEALLLDRRTGNIYVVGDHSVHMIFPASGTARTFACEKQYDTVAVDEATGRAFFVGRASGRILVADPARGELSRLEWVEREESMGNLNQTPPPPIRKIYFDGARNRLLAIDGFTSEMTVFQGDTLARQTTIRLDLQPGGRWHFAGYHPAHDRLYLVTETDDRKVVEAARLDLANDRHQIIHLPGLSEGVGITSDPQRDEIYIAYDNDPTLHVVDFSAGGTVHEVKLPAYGNDAVALDTARSILYIASWAHGEVDVVDLKSRRLVKRIEDLGVIPHMFSMCFHPADGQLYIPLGATAVNGSFGAAITALDPDTEKTMKIRTGWAPVDLLQIPGQDAFLVFGSEDQYARLTESGVASSGFLPCRYPSQAAYAPNGEIYLAYGPHQTYWPVVYIWGARNGILRLHPTNMTFYDRRIPRLAHEIVVDRDGTLYALQNNWGKEKLFLTVLDDEIRLFDPGRRIELTDEAVRETTPRVLRYDPALHHLYVVRTGETDTDPGDVQIVNLHTRKVVKKIEVGLTPTDLAFDDQYLLVPSFDNDTVCVIDKHNFSWRSVPAGEAPLKAAVDRESGTAYIINHLDNSLQVYDLKDRLKSSAYPLPVDGYPDNVAVFDKHVVITSHAADALTILFFRPVTKTFETVHRLAYPFGNTRFDTANTAFYMRGQFGDGIFDLTRIRTDDRGRIWISDFLSGKVLVVDVPPSGL
ncbi:MAG: hypothetical protein JXQ27_17665 [Acidobacteria bacterium]|nr:hypothetical protein [Acidobacteriota bacterium]